MQSSKLGVLVRTSLRRLPKTVDNLEIIADFQDRIECCTWRAGILGQIRLTEGRAPPVAGAVLAIGEENHYIAFGGTDADNRGAGE